MAQDPFLWYPQHYGMLCHMTLKTVRQCPSLKKDLKRFFFKMPFVITFRLSIKFLRVFNLDFGWCCKAPLNIRILALFKYFIYYYVLYIIIVGDAVA